jgi:hypothetical protein
LASPRSGFSDDCGGGGEVAIDVAGLVFFDFRFFDHFSNLLASNCGNFLGWVGDCSGSLEFRGCLFDMGLGDEF